MKTSNKNLVQYLDQNSLDQLTQTTPETLATGYQEKNSKSFSSADLWNIQRMQRTSVSRRRYF